LPILNALIKPLINKNPPALGGFSILYYLREKPFDEKLFH